MQNCMRNADSVTAQTRSIDCGQRRRKTNCVPSTVSYWFCNFKSLRGQDDLGKGLRNLGTCIKKAQKNTVACWLRSILSANLLQRYSPKYKIRSPADSAQHSMPRMMKRLRLFLATMLGIMIFKLLIVRNQVHIVEEVSNTVEEAVSVTLKLVEENSPVPVVNVAALPPKSVEIVPDIDSETAELNQVTKSCCRKAPDIPESCYGLCAFDKLNSQTIVELAIRTSPCKMGATGIWNLMLCMSSGHDHTDCCLAKGVDRTVAGTTCLHFCTGRLEPGPIKNMGYFPCLEVWEPITECFKSFIIDDRLVKMGEDNQVQDKPNVL